MNPHALLRKYFPDDEALAIITEHSQVVAEKALTIAAGLNDPALDLAFIEEAALLHDIGICRTNTPDICCHGTAPYICHGIIGRDILEAEGLHRHALLCERHIGVGLTREDVIRQALPLPHRDMLPLSREERIICFADLFFSKRPGRLSYEKTVTEVKKGLAKFGTDKTVCFDQWHSEFCVRLR